MVLVDCRALSCAKARDDGDLGGFKKVDSRGKMDCCAAKAARNDRICALPLESTLPLLPRLLTSERDGA